MRVQGMGSSLYTNRNYGGGNAKQGLVSTAGRSRSIVFALRRSVMCNCFIHKTDNSKK